MKLNKDKYYFGVIKQLPEINERNKKAKMLELENINIVYKGLNQSTEILAERFLYSLENEREKLSSKILTDYDEYYIPGLNWSQEGFWEVDKELITNLLNEENKNFLSIGAASYGAYFFGFKINNYESIIMEYYNHKKNIMNFQNVKYYSIKPEIVTAVINNQFPLNEFKVLAACKSVIGKKQFAPTSWEQIRGLILGCQSNKDYKEQLKKKSFLKEVEQLTDYQLRKILRALEKKDLIKSVHFRNYYPNRFFISTKFQEAKELTEAILKRRENLINKEIDILTDKKQAALIMNEGLVKINYKKNQLTTLIHNN